MTLNRVQKFLLSVSLITLLGSQPAHAIQPDTTIQSTEKSASNSCSIHYSDRSESVRNKISETKKKYAWTFGKFLSDLYCVGKKWVLQDETESEEGEESNEQ